MHHRQRTSRRRWLFNEHVYDLVSKAGLKAVGAAENADSSRWTNCYRKMTDGERN